MRTRVLAKMERQRDKWVATAYQGQRAFCLVTAGSQPVALAKLTEAVRRALAPQMQDWIKRWTGHPEVPNCPEGAIEVPIDRWVCKVARAPCPIQAKVSLSDTAPFLRHCMAPKERKLQILRTLMQGKYKGFHHVPGRYCCVLCREEGEKRTFQYHYPWELTHITALFELSNNEEPEEFCRRVVQEGLNPAVKYTALCAWHCKQLTERLDPALGARLTVLEFDYNTDTGLLRPVSISNCTPTSHHGDEKRG